MILRDTDLLKEWLIPRLTPICHTDPQALADYIIGLIKKDKPVRMLKDICVEELQVFLMRETVPLVDRLFEVLEGELYLSKGNKSQELGLKEKNYSSSLRCVEKQKTRLDSRSKPEQEMDNQNMGRIKRMKESVRRSQGEVMYGHASMRMKEKTKTIRKSHDSNKSSLSNNRQDLKYNFSDDDSTVEYTTGEENRKDSGDDSPMFEDLSKPGRCKDYDEKGYCLLGDSCPYDHGSDPFVLEPAYNPTPLQVTLPPMPLIAPPILPINPGDPRLILPPPVTQLPISISNSVPMSIPSKTLSATDGYNPENPAYDSVDGDNTVPISGAHGIPPPSSLDCKPIQSQAIYNHQMRSVSSVEGVQMTTISNGGNKKFQHNNQLSTALILRRVPMELNTVAKLSNYFEKFGTVVNVQVRYDNDPEGALVRFTTPQEAKKAHDCTDAVLGNRFIRVFYSRRDRNTSYPPKLKPFELASSVDLVKESLSVPSQPLAATEPEPDKGEMSPEDQDVAPTPTAGLTESMQLSKISSDRKLSPVKPKINKSEIDTKMQEKELEFQKRRRELLDQCLQKQKVLFGKFTESSSPIEKERIKSQIKEVNEQVNKLRNSTEQVQALKTATARMVNNSAQEKKRQDARQNFEAPRTVRPPKDLRGIIDRKPRSLLILSIKVTEKDELMTYLEMFGMIEQVNFNPEVSQLVVTYRTRQEAEKLVHSTYPFKGRNLIMKWSAPKKPLRSQLKYINTRARLKPGHNIKLTRPSLLELSSERKASTKGDMLTPDFDIGFDTDLIDATTNILESSEELPLPDDAFGSISSPGEMNYFNFLEPQISIIDESENDDEEEVYWRRRDKV